MKELIDAFHTKKNQAAVQPCGSYDLQVVAKTTLPHNE